MNREQRIATYTEFMPTSDCYISSDDLKFLGFFDVPASTKYHGAYEGGLFDHSLEVTKALVDLTDKLGLTWSRPESPYIVGMYHDLCKCDSYRYDIDSNSYVYNNDQILDGHGAKSVIVAQKFIRLTDEEIACIRWHMGAFEDDPKLRNGYAHACERNENVLFTHTSDMIASKIMGI